jgi:hypothetical protein
MLVMPHRMHLLPEVHETVRNHIKCHSIWSTPTLRGASFSNVAGDMSGEEGPMSTKKQLCQRYDTHRGHLCHSRGNCRPSLPELTCLGNLSGPSTRRTSDRVDTETRNAPHLPAIPSTILIVESLGHCYDQFLSIIVPTAVTKTGIVPGSLWFEKGQHHGPSMTRKNACPAIVRFSDSDAVVEILGHRLDQLVSSIGPIELGRVPGSLWSKMSAS